MDGFLEPAPLSSEERDSNWRPVLVGVALVLVIVGLSAWLMRSRPEAARSANPYLANVKLSDLKMSQAENFVGASVTYLDGTVSNSGDKSVKRVMAHVTFKDSLGQVAQVEDMPLRVLVTTGPYPEAVDMATSPLAAGQSKSFRLTLEHVAQDWDHAYPDLRVTDVTVQ